jgi:GT2 family glycosyltransferase
MWQRIGPSLDIYYCTDDWLSWRAAAEGYPNVFLADYAFVHHEAQEGRGAGMTERQRRTADARAYEQARHDFIGG